jgi:hypothetical protein
MSAMAANLKLAVLPHQEPRHPRGVARRLAQVRYSLKAGHQPVRLAGPLSEEQISQEVFAFHPKPKLILSIDILVTAAARRPRPRSLPAPPARPLDIYAART